MSALVLLSLAAWLLAHLAPWHGAARLLATGRVDDLVCLPLLLTMVTVVQRSLPGRGPGWRLPWPHTVAAAGLVAAVFEGLLPRLSARYTGDPWDAACYFAGAVLYGIVVGRRSPPGEAAA